MGQIIDALINNCQLLLFTTDYILEYFCNKRDFVFELEILLIGDELNGK